ncbi:tripartite tricarboxylate transporter substrate binding protein [Comamonas antarctica]|uniref:tripartite tricarboxylate transporter substrate binding protein n=1 Tax=Comamonas antarctica TaxID=2743470 RepID=UPI0028EB6D58|nr:tripartite tricarboxylate transporter substrate binding protein [Comamonas antarctica]
MNHAQQALPATRRSMLLALAASAFGPLALAQNGRHFSIIVPQPAGNPSDVFARKLQQLMQQSLGQTVIVENLPGAGGAIGVQRMLNAPADGMTAVMVSQTEPILTPATLLSVRYKPGQMRAVGLLGRTSYVLAGRPDLPAQKHSELLALARQADRSGKPLSFGHIGQGSMIHLMGAQWAQLCGVELAYIPYRGVPPAVQDLAGGQIDLSFVPLGGLALDLIMTGKLRAFGSTAEQAPALLPQATPLKTLESALKNFVHTAWGALLVPRNVPEAAAQRINTAFESAMRDPDVQAFLRSQGTDPQGPMTLAALEQFYQKEIQVHQALARAVGVVAS